MPRPKSPNVVRYTVRLSRAQGERVAALQKQLHASSDNEVFDYLVTVGTNQRDDLEQFVYSLFWQPGRLSGPQIPELGNRQPTPSRVKLTRTSSTPNRPARGSWLL